MTVSLKHTFQSAKTDSADATLIQPSNWNQEHVLTAAAGVVLGRDTSGAGNVQELPISVTSAGNVTIPNNFAVTGTTGLTGNTTVTGTLGVTGTTTVADLNATGTVGFTNALTVPNGGTGVATLPANNVLIGNGTSPVTAVAPGTAGNVLSSNGTSWVSAPAETGAYTEYLNQSTDVTLVAANAGKIIIDPTVSIMVQLPDATTLTAGKTFEITNMSDQNNLFVESSDGTYQAFVAAGQTVNVTAENVSTAAGVWVADNPNYGFSSPVSFGYTGTYNNAAINSATAAISATKMIRINYSAQQAGLTATIITKSGAAITKGSEQFLINFGVDPSIDTGFVNVVMTSATTGIISTIGNKNNSSTNILLYTFSISGSDVVQITGLEALNVSQTAPDVGTSITVLSATSAVIVYHASGNLFARTITLSGGLITAFGSQSTIDPSYNRRIRYPQIAALSATLVVVGWYDTSTGDFYVTAGSISGATITWGTSILQTSVTSSVTCGISRLSATEFIISLGFSNVVWSNYGSVSGTTITLGAANAYTGSQVHSAMSYPISSTSALVVFNDIITGTYKPAAFVLTKSGTALTRGTTYTLATSPNPSPSNPSPFSLKGFVAFNEIQQPATDFYMDFATTRLVFAVPLSVSGTVVTPGTGLLVTPENIPVTIGQLPAICTLSKTRAIAFVYYNVSPDGTAGSRLYLLDTSGARPVVLATSSTISTAAVFCAGQLSPTRALIAYALNFNTTSTIRTLDITGDVFTFNASITGASLIGHRPAIRKVSSTKAMLYVTQSGTDHRIYNIAISGTTLTESPSYVGTGDTTSQSLTSFRILYNLGDVGYYYRNSSGTCNTIIFDVSGVSPANVVASDQTISNSNNQVSYTAIAGAGTMIALASQSGGILQSAVASWPDGVPKAFQAQVSAEFNGFGVTLPFTANSIMVYGNTVNSYGKLTFTPSYAASSTNSTIINQPRVFTPSLAMHEPIQDWVEGDYFAPNTNKILFMGRNSLNLNYEMYHVFDKGAAQ